MAASSPTSVDARARRSFRRRITDPYRAWAGQPWYEQVARAIAAAGVVACCLFVFFQLQPHLLLRDTTPAGGDTGAHVWWPAYLGDHLLPDWRIAGWAPDWYGGFPAGQFYFPLPALLIVALDAIGPYNIAFKVVTALGPVALPVSAYALGRGLRAPRPAPTFMAVGLTAFLFFKGSSETPSGRGLMENQRIMGGNLASTLAGEFSFTIALALAFFFLGALAWSLDRRRRLWLPAVLLAATVLSHLVVGMFAVVGALIVWLGRRPRRTVLVAAAIGGVGALLTLIWTLPLVSTLGYTTDMKYEPLGTKATGLYSTYLFPRYLWWLVPLVVVAVVGGIVCRRRCTLELVALSAAAALLFRFWTSFPTPAWNLRLVPFWYVCLALLAALGLAELVRGAGALAARSVEDGWWTRADHLNDRGAERSEALAQRASDRGPGIPARSEQARHDGAERSERAREAAPTWLRPTTIAVLTALVVTVGLIRVQQTRGYLDFWVRWNYTGYERTGAGEFTAKQYPEFRALVDTMDELPPGRAMWENDSEAIGVYGTPLALMLLPYFTDGRIDSMEGLYYESAASTPYHFMALATLTAAGKASNPVREIPYRDISDFDLGVRYLQLLGVRYYLAQSLDAKQRADAHPSLRLVAQAPDHDGTAPRGWNVYEVADASIVAPLTFEPVVVAGVDPGDWRDDVGVPWFDQPTTLDRPLVTGGPSDWARSDPDDAFDEERVALPPVTVSDVRETNDSVSFRVSRPGVPVLVKTSYFPNWRAEGADGPWRATPNLMVVVPTEREVRLEYGTTGSEWAGRVGTALGLVGLGLLAWWRPGRRNGTTGGRASGDDGHGGDDPGHGVADETPRVAWHAPAHDREPEVVRALR